MPVVRLVVAGLVVLALAGVAVLVGRGGDTYVVPTGPSGSPTASSGTDATAASAVDVVESLADALRRRDGAAAAALAPAADPAAQRRLAALVDNAAALDLRDLSLRFVDAGPVAADGSSRAVVDATWRIPGFDQRPAEAELALHLGVDDDRVVVLGTGGGSQRAPLWWSGPVVVRRAGSALVVAARAQRGQVPRFAGLARTAVATVARELDRPAARLVVEVPGSEPALDAALGARPGTYAGIAAVTAPVDGSTAVGAPAHVFVNPDQFDRLRRAGAQVVMTHETTHAATGATTSQAPLWLVEGFADWVALRDVDLPVTTTAAELITRLRRDGVPSQLPGTDDFAVGAADLDATYEAAWQACVVLAERAGPAALEQVYRRAGAGEPIDAVLRRTAGLGVAGLTAAWRSRLSDLVG